MTTMRALFLVTNTLLLMALVSPLEISAAPRCARQGCPQTPDLASAKRAQGEGIAQPDLSDCAALGRNIARSKYYQEMTKDTQKISEQLGQTSSLYAACHLFSGSIRNACCQKIVDRSVSQCQSQVLKEEAAENPCAPRRVDCRFLRPAKCLLERTIERKRVQCCASIDGQVLNHLLNYCAATVANVSAGCQVPEVPTSTPIPTMTEAPASEIE